MMLSPIQKEIVETSGNLIVRASAGTGKTHTMVSKIKRDIEENHTHKVVAAITFTIKAAAEIKDRLNIDVSEHFIGTNNSFAIEEIIKPFMKDVYGKDYKLIRINRITISAGASGLLLSFCSAAVSCIMPQKASFSKTFCHKLPDFT